MKNSTDLESALSRFLPEGSVELACAMLREHPHHLIITPPRSTKLGDFTPDPTNQRHELTVNGNLNRFAFLITLMHELAHLTTWQEYRNKVKPHGAEWKNNFRKTLGPFIGNAIFPQDIEEAVRKYLANPAASTCSDLGLSRVLARYDRVSHPSIKLLDELPHGSHFLYGKEKRKFVKGARQRTRYLCREVGTNQDYLFNPLVKVLELDVQSSSTSR
jgi:SprT protein